MFGENIMTKRIVLTYFASMIISLFSMLSVKLPISELAQGMVILLLAIGYAVLNITMLIITAIQKEQFDLGEYRLSIAFFIFNIIYPILALIVVP